MSGKLEAYHTLQTLYKKMCIIAFIMGLLGLGAIFGLCYVVNLRAEVRRSFITTTVRDESQVTPQGRHR